MASEVPTLLSGFFCEDLMSLEQDTKNGMSPDYLCYIMVLLHHQDISEWKPLHLGNFGKGEDILFRSWLQSAV